MHPEDHYIDQSPEALRLTLVDGRIDLNSFSIYGSRTLHCGELTIEARVIGASHIISYSAGNNQLHEAFACVSPPPKTNEGWAEISSYNWSGLTHPIERRFGRIWYNFRAYMVPWSDPEPIEVQRLLDMCRDQPSEYDFGFVQHFPQGECLVTPKTIIVGRHDKNTETTVIETAHSYPNVRGLVISRTELQPHGGTQ